MLQNTKMPLKINWKFDPYCILYFIFIIISYLNMLIFYYFSLVTHMKMT